MAGMREIKLRIKGINKTRQITKAMKLISASKLKKARRQLDQMLPYFSGVESTLVDIMSHSGSINSPFFADKWDKQGKTTGLIFITGDKGLAGSYNYNIIKLAEDMIRDAENPVLFVAGDMGRSYFLKKEHNVCRSFDFSVADPDIMTARKMADTILEMYTQGRIDEVYMAYTEMLSPIKQIPQAIRLLPLNLNVLRAELGLDQNNPAQADERINFEPSPSVVFDVIIPKYIKGVIYGALVESFTSELSARMTAMDNATANADEMLHALSLRYNKARQAAITQEILEIVGGV